MASFGSSFQSSRSPGPTYKPGTWGALSGIGNRTSTGAASGGLSAASPAPSAPAAAPTASIMSDPGVFTVQPGGNGYAPPNTLPVDPQFDATTAANDRSHTDTLANISRENNTALHNYGYTGSFDSAGNVSGITFDPNNPFSKAALLNRSYSQEQARTTNGMAARGLTGSSSESNVAANDTFGYNQNNSALLDSLTQYLARNQGARTSADVAWQNANGTAYGDRVARAADSPLYNPATGTDAAPAQGAPTYQGLTGDQANPAKWITTTYRNANGHQVHVYGDGRKEVLIGGTWKRV